MRTALHTFIRFVGKTQSFAVDIRGSYCIKSHPRMKNFPLIGLLYYTTF